MKPYFKIISLVVALIAVVYLTIDSLPRINKDEKHYSDGFCGTSNIYEDKEEEDTAIQEGKIYFNNNCAACHNKNMKNDLTGPALTGSIERWQHDTLAMLNYLNNPRKYFKEKPSKRMVILHRQFGYINKPIMDSITIEEIKNVIKYIEMRYYIGEVLLK